jgi:hypothetical protein
MTPSSFSSDDPTAAERERRDELASALLDGALPADEADAARRDPAVAARAAEMAAARDRVRDVPPLPAGAGDDALAAALGAYDDAAVTSLAGRRSSSSGRRRGAPRWLGAAAALILVAGVVAGLAALGRSDRQGDSSSDVASAGGGGSAEKAQGSGSSGSATQPQPTIPEGVSNLGDLGDLGDAPSPEALARRVAALPEASADSGQLTNAAPQSTTGDDNMSRQSLVGCSPDDATRGRPGATVSAHGRARAGGRPVDVWIVRDGDQTRVVVLDAGCRITADEPAG